MYGVEFDSQGYERGGKKEIYQYQSSEGRSALTTKGALEPRASEPTRWERELIAGYHTVGVNQL